MSMEVGSVERESEDHGREHAHCGHPREKAEEQAGATRHLNACQQKDRGWMDITTEGHGCEREGGRHPSARASTGCVGARQQSPGEVDLLGRVVVSWDALDRRCWMEEEGVGWSHRCVNHLWVGRGWRCFLEEAEEGLSGQAVVRQC